MRLLGVSFDEYACFESRFVPLNDGVTVLTGMNNAGKTALLRGLSALSALPITSAVDMNVDLSRYARNRPSTPRFGIGIWYEVETKDQEKMLRSVGSPLPLSENGTRLEFKFVAFPNQKCIVFESCTIHSEKGS